MISIYTGDHAELEEQARAAVVAMSEETLADIRQNFLRFFAALHHHHCTTSTQRTIRKQMLHFLADAAVETETDAELAQYLVQACLLHEQQGLPEPLTTAGAGIAEVILGKKTIDKVQMTIGNHAARSGGEFSNRQSSMENRQLEDAIAITLLSVTEFREKAGLPPLLPGCGETLHTIGRVVGMSRERIRQIEAKALIKIRRAVLDKPELRRELRHMLKL